MKENQTHEAPTQPSLKDKRRKSGFTLMEILLVMALLGGLVVLGFNQVGRMLDDGNADIARIFVNDTMKASLFRYRIDNGRYPSTEEGLASLMTAPSGSSNWKGPYMDVVPADPWGRDYQYSSPGKKNTSSYDVYSFGGDGAESADDIGNWH
jgi:general secretion pathway protein G